MKKQFRVIRREKAQLSYASGKEQGNSLFRSLDETMSDSLGAGYFSFNGVTDRAVLPYDEMSVCIEGTLELTIDGQKHVLLPGDLVSLPKGTDVVFGGEKAVAAYSVWPVDWRSHEEAKASVSKGIIDKVEIVRRGEAQLSFQGGTPDGHAVYRAFHEGNSSQIGAGYARLNSFSSTMIAPFDEVAFCIEGTYRATVEGVEYVLSPGDFMFVPKGTELAYSGDNAVMVYTIWPVDWRSSN